MKKIEKNDFISKNSSLFLCKICKNLLSYASYLLFNFFILDYLEN